MSEDYVSVWYRAAMEAQDRGLSLYDGEVVRYG